MKPKKVLLLCHYYPGAAGTIIDHVEAFRSYSENEYFIISNLGDLPEWLDLSRFDALVFHYSLIACYDNYISPSGRQRISEFKGFKAAFVQDDYRWINDTVNALAYMGIHALFPLTNPDIMDSVYSPKKLPKVRKETVLAGYVPQALVDLEVPSYEARQRDVAYRARKLPAWMGSHTVQKWEIAERFASDAQEYGLNVDISVREEDRVYGDQWIDFISNSRATLGTESGASVCDFTGDIQRNVEAHLQKYPATAFEVLRDLYFQNDDGNIMMNVISPRCFESAALRTLMILYEGAYSGVLVPWRHYVPLKRDHSNMDDVVRILRSPKEAQAIIDLAYTEIAKNQDYAYSAMVKLVDRVMREEWSGAFVPAKTPFIQEEFEWLSMHRPRSASQATTSHGKVALWHRQTEEATPRRPAGAPSKPSIQIPFERPTSVAAVAIRLSGEMPSTDLRMELVGSRHGKIKYTSKLPSGQLREFLLATLPLKAPTIDLLSFRLLAAATSAQPTLLSISVLGTEPATTRRWVAAGKRTTLWVLVRCWNVVPEKARLRLRPVTDQVIARLVRLLT